jgi:hypothetical protein
MNNLFQEAWMEGIRENRGTISCRLAFLMVIALLQVGCADSNKIIRPDNKEMPTFMSKEKIYIAINRDGVYGDEAYPGSGLTLSQLLLSSFSKHIRRVEMGKVYQQYDDALLTSRSNGFNILIYPTILHWENHLTEWNGIPDKVKVKVDVIGTEKDDLLYNIIIEGKSGLATFGGDQPQDLLVKPIDEFVSSMFPAGSAVSKK